MTNPRAASHFTCDCCGRTFPYDPDWSEEDVNAEARENFGVDITQDPTMATVCDDCYLAMTTLVPPKEWTKAQAAAGLDKGGGEA